jgi:hypothetical protein
MMVLTMLPYASACKNTVEATALIDRLLPAPKNGGFQDPDYWIWGYSMIKGEDGRYRLFASRWAKEVGFGNWVTNSEVVRAISDKPVGPFQFLEVVLPIRGKEYFDGMCTHNPRIIKYKDQYLLYHFGTTNDFPLPDREHGDTLKDGHIILRRIFELFRFNA